MWPGGFAVEWITHPSHGRLPGWAFTHLDDCLSDWIHIIGTEGLYKCLKTGLELRHLSLTHTHTHTFSVSSDLHLLAPSKLRPDR